MSTEYLYQGFLKAEDIDCFRAMQRKTGAIVSGSVLVERLSNAAFEPRDLDVFVKERGTLDAGACLSQCGFEFTPLPDRQVGGRRETKQQPAIFVDAVDTEFADWNPNTGTVADRYDCTHIAGVFNFVNKEKKVVQQVTSIPTVLHRVLTSTQLAASVMNFATAVEIVYLFPTLTFVDKKNLVLRDADSPAVKACIWKYEQRGWDTIETLSAFDALRCDSDTRAFHRSVGDDRCWKIRLTPSDKEERGLLSTMAPTWTLSFPTRNETRLVYSKSGNEAAHAEEGKYLVNILEAALTI
ncbi:hypothetical protein VNI00_010193 [Paramarasmius palmivorus]|uniref:Uncharacterized protein n=1 Tax=Paramarasmius palmivorus TaxID=297713 RepID=A0AAW0CHE8_9AGAR